MKGWLTHHEGGSGTWLYSRCLDHGRHGRYLFIRIMDLVDAMGVAEAPSWFDGRLSLVDLIEASPEDLLRAADSCGLDLSLEYLRRNHASVHLSLAEACHDYGLLAPLASDDTGPLGRKADCWSSPDESWPRFVHMRARLRRQAEAFEAGDESALDRVVNQLGQTAREYARGIEGTWEALRRIKSDPNATDQQKLVIRMYGDAETMLGAGPIPADLREDDHG
jgi:hypothetical protein